MALLLVPSAAVTNISTKYYVNKDALKLTPAGYLLMMLMSFVKFDAAN